MYVRLGFICVGPKKLKNLVLAEIQYQVLRFFVCSNSNKSEYPFVFAVLLKYYLHYNIPNNTTQQHTTTKMIHCHVTLQGLSILSL